MADEAQNHVFQIDLKGIITLLAHHLYSESDVFVREMLQNAHDSIQRRKVEEKGQVFEGSIQIKLDHMQRTISFIDNGRGLTESEIHKYLATIGSSGTKEFRQKLDQRGLRGGVDVIGQFGIGLLSAFVVADYVEVITQSSTPNQPAWRWVSSGDKDYTLEKWETYLDKENDSINSSPLWQQTDDENIHLEVGTIVRLHIAARKYDDLLQEDTIRSAIRKYADFLQVPIYLNDDIFPTNAITPPWQRIYADEYEKRREHNTFLNKRFPDSILYEIPVNITTPLQVNGSLFISDRMVLDFDSAGAVDIYQNGMFVQNRNQDFLPRWARFIRGVIDSPDLTLTLARDGVQRDGKFFEAREAVGKTIIAALKRLAREDADKLKLLLNWHALSVLLVADEDESFFYEIADLVPLETNRDIIDLQTYFQYSHAVDEYNKPYLYYFTESSSASLYYLLSDEKSLVVVNASNPLFEAFLKKYAAMRSVHLQKFDVSDEALFKPLSPKEKQEFHQLEIEIKQIMGNPQSTVQFVSFSPKDMPAVLMLSTSAELRRKIKTEQANVRYSDTIRGLLEELEQTQPKDDSFKLYLNASNSIIQRLPSLDPRSEAMKNAIVAIYSTSLLLAAPKLSKTQIELIVRQINQVIDLLINNTASLESTRAQLSANEIAMKELNKSSMNTEKMTSHVSCFVAIPFNGYDVLLDALREVLEDEPYFWQVLRADQETLDPTLSKSVFQHIARAHCYIAEVSELNFNVGMELGIMQLYDKPRILLRHKNAKPEPADLKGLLYIEYPSLEENPRKDDLVKLLREQFSRIKELKRVKGDQHYLSLTVLNNYDGLNARISKGITEEFVTMEAFIAANPRIVAKKLKVDNYRILQELKEYLRKICEG